MDTKYYVYILRCRDGTFYTGYTNDLARRWAAHRRGKGAKYTRGRLPLRLVYWERVESQRVAMQREWEIKHAYSRQQKLALITQWRQHLRQKEGCAVEQAKDLGKFYICGTPIGNLEDITLRQLRILREVDLIAAEDTRHTRKLLNHYEIKTPLTSYHEHNKQLKGDYLLGLLREGKNIALVSDAGMPGISDPGYELIQQVIAAGITPIPVPGPTAATTALVISGLPTDRFVFEGFLPRLQKERRNLLQTLQNEKRTLVFYEAPHRLIGMLQDLLAICGDREVAVMRELTKKYEEVLRGKVSVVLAQLQAREIKGEFVVVVEGMPATAGAPANALPPPAELLFAAVQERMARGTAKKEAIKETARQYGLPKEHVYRIVVELSGK